MQGSTVCPKLFEVESSWRLSEVLKIFISPNMFAFFQTHFFCGPNLPPCSQAYKDLNATIDKAVTVAATALHELLKGRKVPPPPPYLMETELERVTNLVKKLKIHLLKAEERKAQLEAQGPQV